MTKLQTKLVVSVLNYFYSILQDFTGKKGNLLVKMTPEKIVIYRSAKQYETFFPDQGAKAVSFLSLFNFAMNKVKKENTSADRNQKERCGPIESLLNDVGYLDTYTGVRIFLSQTTYSKKDIKEHMDWLRVPTLNMFGNERAWEGLIHLNSPKGKFKFVCIEEGWYMCINSEPDILPSER